jgi:undecaprenyl-diphosphatase
MGNLAVTFLASFLIWFLYAGLLILWFVDGKIKKEIVIHALLASLTAWLLAEFIKSLIPTARPFLLNGNPIKTLTFPFDGAFPSAHAAAAFALAVTVWFHDRKVGWIYLASALIIGIARVIANVHYPQDILGGATLGILVSFSIKKLSLSKLLRKK